MKIARRNINNLIQADDTTLMAESKEELKSLLMRVKEESENVGFKLHLKKTKIMASGLIQFSSVAQSCLTLCSPMDCSLTGSSVHGIFLARVLEWGAISFSRDLPNAGIELGSPTLQADALPSEPRGSYIY